MSVYEGVLETISQGEVLPTGPTSTTISEGAFGNIRTRHTYARQGGYTRREFVQVGDTRITGVMLMPYYDALLVEAVGKPVALSIDKTGSRNTVIAMRTPDAGLIKPEFTKLVFAAVWSTITTWIVAIIGGVILCLILAAIFGTVGFVIGVLATLAFAFRPLLHVWRTFRASAALNDVALPTPVSAVS